MRDSLLPYSRSPSYSHSQSNHDHSSNEFISSSSSFSQNSARLYSPSSTPNPPASLSLRTDLVSEPLVPTTPNTPTSPRAKTVTFTLSPTATINSVLHILKKATGIVKLKSTLAPNKSVTVEKKKRTFETVGIMVVDLTKRDYKSNNLEQNFISRSRSTGGDCREKIDKAFEKLTRDNRCGDENHTMEDSEGSGQVVSCSSCTDNQLAWEFMDGKSMI
ncbi:hypothetical protein K435DRAFT_965251 [Dendrothele bispora CBS 962.96]|uniref:Uncharacterized protein n=1 Tax=Dendrothele bispora (strain CBS 962.96) TaxID=1314807 RepID=A0A4S8M6A7_DENBC|nr:hypothetical protein K435DRAFT_965251 [Dendrothele bispora CBS 962.96]